MIATQVIDAILEQVVQTGTSLAFDQFVETERGRQVLSKLGVSRELAAHDFEGIYKRAVLEYSVNCYRDHRSKQIIRVFSDPGLQNAFEASLRTQNLMSVQSCIAALYEASTETGELAGIEPIAFEHELGRLSDIFNNIVAGLRPLYLDPLEHKLDANHQALMAELVKLQAQIASSQESSAPVVECVDAEIRVSSSPEAAYLRKLSDIEEKLGTNPADTDLWLRKASLLYEANEFEAALRAINRASELDSDSIEVLHARACILCDYAASQCNSPRSFFAEALEIFEKVRLDVGEALVDYHIGNALSGLGRHDAAVAKFQQAIKTLTKDELKARAWTNMGNSYIALSQGDNAIEAFQHALKLDSKKWQALLSWGEYELKQKKDFELAAQLYWNALSINPSLEETSARATYDLAFALWNLHAYADAYRYANRVLNIDPTHEDAKLLKAHLLLDLWRESEAYIFDAIKFFEAWLVDNPDNAFALHVLHAIYDSEGYKDRARLVIDRNPNPESVPPFVCYDYAMFLKSEGELDEAIRWLEIAVKQSQEHHYVHQFAHLQLKKGNYRTALQYYRLAIIDCSDPENVMSSIADCYFLLKEYRQCVAIMMKLIRSEPQSSTWWTNLSYALIQLGKRNLLPSADFMSRLQKDGDIDANECIQQQERMLEKLEKDFGTSFIEMIKSDQLPVD